MISWHWLSRSSTFVWIFWARGQCLVKRWPDLVRPLPMWENYSRLRSALWRATRYTQNVPKLYRKISASKTWIQYFRKSISLQNKIGIQYFRKNISSKNLDTIFSKKYQPRNFGYNTRKNLSYLYFNDFWIQYFRKNISLENLDTIFLKKYQPPKFGYNTKKILSDF